jgi:hypothetical protein
MADLKFKIWHEYITTSTTGRIFSCNELTLINKGTVNVTIDGGFILSPGESITYPCRLPNELNITAYPITFPVTNANGQLCVAICKKFVDKQ